MAFYLESSDEDLCQRARDGDRLAEEYLVTEYSRMVRACARPYFLAGGDSEDLLQEGMIGLISAIRGYQPERGTPFQMYAETCVQNRIRSAIRSAGRSKHAPLNRSISLASSLFDSDFGTCESQNDLQHRESPEDMLIHREEEQGRLETIAAQLSPFEKKVLESYLKGLSWREIAEQVHKPVKSVENAVQRIRRKVIASCHFGDFSVN